MALARTQVPRKAFLASPTRQKARWRVPCSSGELEEESEARALRRLGPADAMGMVLYGQGGGPADVPLQESSTGPIEGAASRSPRRTQHLEFTCNVCGERNKRLVNPRAMQQGTVIVKCKKCGNHHKIVDHLQLFQEYYLKDPLRGIGVTLGRVEQHQNHTN
mmetsp:Transcript_5832/g.36187  ORF Transcript_5832/g.36187 Transcript_5832/m.36187 type:complete len:162 (-) Transcript_5832:223-708(-)